MSDVGRKMAKGAAWLVLSKLVDRGIGIISTLFLARLLVPADFGLIAMAMSILAALELLTAFSFDLALIQNQKAERHHYDTAWTFGLIFGLVNALGMAALAAPAAAFYAEPRIEGLMYAFAAIPILQGLSNVGIVAFQKDLELHKEFWFGLAKKLAGFVVTISLALTFKTYWALVAGIVASRVTGLVLSYLLHPFRPRFSLAGARDLFNFSKWLLLNNFLIFLNNRGTDFIIGKISGARALGLYSVSYEIANLPTTELVFPISRAIFPGYARLAGDVVQLRKAFLQVIGLLAILTIPAGAGIGLVAEPLVHVLLGEKWSDAAPLIEVLAVFGIVRAIHGPTGSIYLALGKPRVVAVLQSIQIVTAILLMLYLLPALGPIGAAWSILVGATLAMIVNYLLVMRELSMSFMEIVKVFWRPACGAGAMALAVAAFGPTWGGASGLGSALASLLLMIGTGAVAYVFVVVGLWVVSGKPEGPEAQVLQFVGNRLKR